MKIVQYPKKISIKTALPKKYVVWHGSFSRTKYSPYGSTAVKATAVADQWATVGEKQGAPYLIDRDGTIYKIYEDHEWTYHLNLPVTKGYYDKQSIPVMIANELHLLKENGQFYAFEYPHSTNSYLGPVVNCDWHSQKYWAKIDDAQIEAAIDITIDICDRHKIEPIFYIGKKHDPKIWDKATIFTHSTVNNQVYDFPPFDESVIAKIKAKGIKIID